MESIKFPIMFNTTSTSGVSDKESNAQSILLLLQTERGSLFGDPYYGTRLKKIIFEQNGVLLKDIIIDEIYDSITTFLPKIFIRREDINVYSKKQDIYATINYKNIIDGENDMLTINLLNQEV